MMSSVINTIRPITRRQEPPFEMPSFLLSTCLQSQAYVRRFPKCPLIPVFVDSEVVGETQSEDGSISVTERRCTIDIDAPRLLKRVSSSAPFPDLVNVLIVSYVLLWAGGVREVYLLI